MARLSDDDYARLQARMDRDTAAPLGVLRRASGAQQNEQTEAWLHAGDNLAEKAIAALDLGEEERAARLVRRIIALPVVDGEVHAGLMAVNLVLYNQVLDPDFEDEVTTGLLDAPLRMLPGLSEPVADELRLVLASLTDYELPQALVRRIHAVVPEGRRHELPFTRVPEQDLPAVLTDVLRLILRLRSES